MISNYLYFQTFSQYVQAIVEINFQIAFLSSQNSLKLSKIVF